VSVPKHERLIELLADGFWSGDNAFRAVTCPERMATVVEKLVEILQSQPRGVDDDGALYWAGQWLKERLEREGQDG
jgi:hypothetical protein